MRSLLFVPADSERKLLKGLEAGADVIILDLEDSIAAANKATARAMAAEFIAARHGMAGPRLYVRVNDLTTGLTDDDLASITPARPAGIMLPKAQSAADVEQVSAMLRVHEARAGAEDGAIRIMPIITETALSLFGTAGYASPIARLSGLTWGSEDLSASIGARASRDDDGRLTGVFQMARTLTLIAAAAGGLPSVDTVYTDFRDDAGLKRECDDAERDGFSAKMAIHPAQVPIINAAFTPAPEAIERSRAVVAAFEAAGNPGVVAIDGKMYDRPHLRLAERLLARADAGSH
ncbi:MAG: CoA ester lyase [Rhizobiaceae bacterium]|nr:CoA ester lyase [Rhizobiaceae bacterium]